MFKHEIKNLLDALLDKESEQLHVPTRNEWLSLEHKFDCKFPSEFVWFIELMSEYSFDGEILNASDFVENGNDTISYTFDYECELGN